MFTVEAPLEILHTRIVIFIIINEDIKKIPT